MTIARRVRDLRYAKGWGPDELASRAEISRTALYQIECGKTETPRAGTLKRIARALDVSIEALLANEEGGALDLSALMRSEHQGEGNHVEQETVPVETSMARAQMVAPQRLHPAREAELFRKFHELLVSPMAESIARIVEESHRLIPQSRSTRASM